MNQQKLKQNNQKVCIQHGRRQSMIRDFRGSRATVKRATRTLLLRGMLIAAIALIVPGSVLVALFAPQIAQAQTPNTTVNFQARILTSTGAIVPDGNYHIEFKLYDSVGSGASAQGVCSLNSSTDDCWWLETRSTGNLVRVVNGYISVNLGSVTAFGSSIPWSQDLYVTMRVGGTSGPSWDSEMTNGGNRMKLNVAPLALVSNNVRTANRTSTASDNITIQTGNTTTSGNSGNVAIDVGTAASTAGTISLGSANASALSLGRTGITTTNTGALTVTQLTTLNGGLTVETGDTFTFNGDAFTDLTGTGLTISTGALTVDAVSATGAFINGGNAFTANATLGINANYDLNVETNSLTRLTVQADGDVAVDTDTLFVNATDNNVVIGGTTRTANESLTVITADGRSGIVHTNGTVAVGTAIGFNQAYFGTDTNHALLLYANGVDSFGINTSNTVFVGSTATGATLASGLGDLLVQGNLEVKDKTLVTGAVTDAVEGSLLLVTGTSTSTTNNQYGASLEIVAAPASASIRHFAGASIYASTTSANLTGGTLTGSYNGAINDGTGTVNKVQGIVIETGNGSTGTINLLKGINVWTPNNVSGTITNAYGISIDDQTAGTNDYGLAIEGADTYAFWLGSGADNTDAANGITFGLSGDTNLYRSAANTLRTDDSLSVGGTLAVTGNTTLTGDLAVNGNDITTGAGDLTITPAGGDTVVTGTLTVTTSATVNGLLTGTLGATISGATANINASSNFATNINTGTSTGAISIGNSLAGVTTIQGAASATALRVLDASSAPIITVDSAARSGSGGNLLKVGNSTGTDTATTILQLDSATAVPTTNLSALNGGLFYNSTTNKVSIIENGVVKVVCNATDASCGGNSTTLQQSYDADADGSDATIALTSTDGSLILSNPSSGGSTSAYVLNVNQLATGAVGGLDVQSAGTGNLFRVRDTTATASDVLTIADGGAATFKNQTNSTSAFQIQNAAGASLFNVDTTGSVVNIASEAEFSSYIDSPYGGFGVVGLASSGYGNLLLNTESLDNGTWARTNITSVTDGATAPNGNANADTIITTGSGTHTLVQTETQYMTAGTYTFSVWLKSSTSESVQLRIDAAGGTIAPTTGTSASHTTGSAWKRYSVTQAFTGAGATSLSPTIVIPGHTATVVAWGAQLVTGSERGVYAVGDAVDTGIIPFNTAAVVQGSLVLQDQWEKSASLSILSNSGAYNGAIVLNAQGTEISGNGIEIFQVKGGGTVALRVRAGQYSSFEQGLQASALLVGTTDYSLTASADLSFDQGSDRSINVNARTSAGVGRNLTISAGQSSGANAGGLLTLQGGAAAATSGSNGGAVTLAGAAGTSTSTGGNGGAVTISGGAGTSSGNRSGGAVSITAGLSTGNATGGTLGVTSGQGGATGAGGALTVTSGAGGATSGNSGAVSLKSGNVTSGTAGNLTLDVGTSTSGAPTIDIGNSTNSIAKIITIGGTTQTGNIVLGQSTATNTVNIANANTLTGSTQTINIGAGTPAGTGLTNITIGNILNGGTLSLNSGTGNINLQAGGTSTIARVQIGAGGAGNATPDFLGLDVKSTTGDPAGGAEGFIYYNTFDNKFRCFQGVAWTDCIGSGVASALQASYDIDGDGSDTRIDLTTADDSLIISNPTSSGTDSGFVLKVEQLNTGIATDALTVSNSGSGDLLEFQDAGTAVLRIGDGGNILGANTTTGTTATTSGTGTDTTTLVFTGTTSFANNDIILIDNAGQDYYTRIVSGGTAASVTVSPAVTFETGRTVTKYIAQNIGRSSYSATNLQDRFFEGYFLGGVVTGAGSTTLSDGSLVSTNSLNFRATGNLTVGVSDTTGTLFVLDAKTDAGDPTCVNGGMYYNSNSASFRVCKNSAWVTLVAGVDIQNFTANGNWTRPSGTTVVMVIMCGGGGSGGGGYVGSGGGGTGGGGGAYVVNTFSAGDTVAVGATVAVTVGASSTGGTVGNNGNAGNYSSFGTLVKASGGGAGGAGASGVTTASGGGGGGMVTVGGAGGASNSAGGENTGSGSAGTGWSGGGGVLNGAGTSAQMGGGAGGGSIGNAIGKAGGGSIYGGAGGGGGGGSGGGGPYAGAAGGGTGLYTSGGGGAAGATDTGGTAGTAGNSTHCGTGGGGGGARSATAGGVGGAGGTAGGAGGGGGAGSSAGAGGAGGRGEVWVYSW